MAELAKPTELAGEAALLGLGSSRPALPAMHASLWDTCWWPGHCCLGGNLHLQHCSKSGSRMTQGHKQTSRECLHSN